MSKISTEAREFAASRQTRDEIAQAIFDCVLPAWAQHTWEAPTAQDRASVLSVAFAMTDEDELFWGQERVTRGAAMREIRAEAVRVAAVLEAAASRLDALAANRDPNS